MTADFDDFDPPEPRARRPRAKTAAAGERGARPASGPGSRALALARRYPLELAIAVALTSAVGAVAFNALALQTSRHPAPFFGQGGKIDGPAPLPPARPALALPAAPAGLNIATLPGVMTPAAPAPVPARPAARVSIGELIRSGDVSVPQPPRAAPIRLPLAPAEPPAARDPIGDLIRLGGGAPPPPPALVGKPDPARTIAAGQRALAKLGYGPTKADGLMGPGTRQAIERFERDRNLPVTGEFGGRTARELSALAAIPVE